MFFFVMISQYFCRISKLANTYDYDLSECFCDHRMHFQTFIISVKCLVMFNVWKRTRCDAGYKDIMQFSFSACAVFVRLRLHNGYYQKHPRSRGRESTRLQFAPNTASKHTWLLAFSRNGECLKMDDVFIRRDHHFRLLIKYNFQWLEDFITY